MIDLHLHVLPAVDDGAGDLKVSRAMLERIAGMGFTRLVTTPHLMEPLTPEYRLATTQAHEATRSLATDLGISLDLGYEHLLSPDLTTRLRNGEPSTLAGSNAVMVELPFVGWPRHTESSLFDLRIAGYIPVLAHPERYVEVQAQPEKALTVADRGVVLQLTFASFAGLYGRAAEHTAKVILEAGVRQGALIVLATDAHSDGHRLTSVPEGINRIRRNFKNGDAIVEWASRTVPSLLLANEAVPAFNDWHAAMPEREPEKSGIRGNGNRGVRGLLRPLGLGVRARVN